MHPAAQGARRTSSLGRSMGQTRLPQELGRPTGLKLPACGILSLNTAYLSRCCEANYYTYGFHKTSGYISQKAFPIVGLYGLKVPAASRLDCLTACSGEL